MKHTFFIIPVTLLLMACRTQREVVVERRVERDTVYQDRMQYDSVYVERNVATDRSRDTVLIRETEYRVKYKLVHDSIHIVRVDSIPYTVTIEKREEIPKAKRVLNNMGYISLLLVVGYVVSRLCR